MLQFSHYRAVLTSLKLDRVMTAPDCTEYLHNIRDITVTL